MPIRRHGRSARSLKVLAELATSYRTTRAAVIAATEELGIYRSQCYELLRRFRRSPTVTSLLPRTRGRGRGVRMLKPEVEAVIETVIDEFYLDLRCPTIADLIRDIARRCASKDLKSPTYNSVVQRVRARDQREVVRRRVCRSTSDTGYWRQPRRLRGRLSSALFSIVTSPVLKVKLPSSTGGWAMPTVLNSAGQRHPGRGRQINAEGGAPARV
jgi:hypothetical protein